MSPEPRADASLSGGPRETRPPARRAALAGVTVALALQVAVATAALAQPRPAHYGWQMYSATQPVPDAWAVSAGTASPIDIGALLVHDRAEIDFAEMLRVHGCERTGADAVRIELPDRSLEEVICR